MDRNLWLAVGLSAGVYLVWYGYFDKKVNPRPAPAPYSSSAVAGSAGSVAAPGAAAASAPDAGAPKLDVSVRELLADIHAEQAGRRDEADGLTE